MWRQRCERAEPCGVAYQDVEPSIALIERRREFVDLDEVAQVERHQRRAAARRADRVVAFLQSADRASDEHDMRPLARETLGHRGPDAA